VTGPGDVSRETPSTWREYQDIISHVRSQYLATVQAAREQREATTGYAFDEFAAVERRAWHTYHEAGRRAWANYQASQQEQPPPPARAVGYEPNFPPAYRQDRDVKPGNNQPASHPYPPVRQDGSYDVLNHGQATFTAHPGNEPGDDNLFNRITERGEYPYPKNGALDQFDARQETYLAADPETRDNQ
jgi:hypothetical protein